jgi:hypothetical protein
VSVDSGNCCVFVVVDDIPLWYINSRKGASTVSGNALCDIPRNFLYIEVKRSFLILWRSNRRFMIPSQIRSTYYFTLKFHYLTDAVWRASDYAEILYFAPKLFCVDQNQNYRKIVPHPPYFLKSFPFTLEVLENSFNVLIYFAFFIVEYINLQSNFYPLSAFTTLIFVK